MEKEKEQAKGKLGQEKGLERRGRFKEEKGGKDKLRKQ